MSPLARRGRVWYVVLTTLIVLEALWRIQSALRSEAGQANLLRSVVVPGLAIAGMVSLWWFGAWLRRTMAFVLFVHGVSMLLPVGVAALKLMSITPADQRDFLLRLTAMVAGIVFLHAALYFVAGSMLLFSSSLVAFLDGQQHGFDDQDDADDLDETHEQLVERLRNQLPFAVLTRAKLEALRDDELAAAVANHVDFKVDIQDVSLSSLPRGFRAVYTTWWCEAEINNGGFYQFFYNKGVEFAFMALEGYKLFGATRHAELVARAIDIYLREEPEQMKICADDSLPLLQDFVKGRKVSSLPELDDEFYNLDEATGAGVYIRAHLDEFVSK